MPDSDAPPTPQDPVESTGSSPLIWIKLALALIVAVAAIVTGILTPESMASLADSSEIADFHGVKAATFAMCAIAMLSLTMIPAGSRPGERGLDLVVRLGSLAFAFLSGWFWLESALGDVSLRYYLFAFGILVLVTSAGIMFWPLTVIVYQSTRTLLRHIRR